MSHLRGVAKRIRTHIRQIQACAWIVLFLAMFMLLLGAIGNVIQWQMSKYESNDLLVMSVIFILLSLLSSYCMVWLDRKTRNQPKHYIVLHTRLKTGQFESLKEISQEIMKRAGDPAYANLIFAPVLYIGMLLGYASMYLFIFLGEHRYFDFLVAIPSQALIIFILLFILFLAYVFIFVIPTILLLFLSKLLVEKYLDFPRDEDFIFAASFIIADHLATNDRISAKKGVSTLIKGLTQFQRNWLNSKRSVYSPEFNVLRKSQRAISRMIMLGQEQIHECFLSFGMAFAEGNDPKAYDNLKRIVNNTMEFGEPVHRIAGFFSRIERYPRSTVLVLGVIVLILAIVTSLMGYPDISAILRKYIGGGTA